MDVSTLCVQFLAPVPGFELAFKAVCSAAIPKSLLKAWVGLVALSLCAQSGINAMAAVTSSPTSLSWASVAVGNPGAQKVVTLSNSGSTTLSIASIALSGTNPGDFKIFSKTCGPSLAASASCTVNIVFDPTTAGTRSATLDFNDNVSGSPQTVSLSGLGVSSSGRVMVSPTSLSFGAFSIGSSSPAQSSKLTNGTSSGISISSVAISGANPGDFSITSNTCGKRLSATSSCSAAVIFKPTAAGTRSATLTYTNSSSTVTVALSGTGSSNSSSVTTNHTSLNFPATAIGSSSSAMSTVLQNGTAASLSIIGVSITGTNAGDFSISSNQCGSSLAASGSCSVSVVFKPSASGTRTASLNFADTGNSSPQTVSLSGTGGGASSGSLAVYPSSEAVAVGTQQEFQAQLTGTPDFNSLTFSIDGISGGNSSVGTVTDQGLYTAPNSPGTHQLVVSDNSLGTTSNSWITVFSNVSVDFGSRSPNANPVPPGLFGAQYLDSLHNAADLDMVKAGGITSGRLWAGIVNVFATSTPNWSAIDSSIAKIAAAGGMHVTVEMYQSPSWLQQNNCGTYSMPSDVTAWASIAQQYVQHFDTKFPGVVTDYEIWNEPNIALCVPSGDSTLTDYMKLYSAAAPLMKAQAKTDGQKIRVGGPVTAGVVSNWITTMLADPTISQNIDFLSYHFYLLGVPGEKAAWDTFNGTQSVYQATQDIHGPANFYEYVGALVSGGKQPQGKNLPIYITEYNLDWEFAKNCCSNDFTYAPLWNSLYVADLLDSPFAYSGSPNSITRLDYYAASAVPYYCLIGLYDTNMDCSYPVGSTPQPYPQLFAYQLFGSPNYLGLQNGAYMAASMSPPRLSNGMVVTAFFTPSLDAVVLINPSQYTYTNMPVNITNSGLTSASGTLYRIANGQSIQSSSLSLQSTGQTSYSTTLTLPPYSVQAISLR